MGAEGWDFNFLGQFSLSQTVWTLNVFVLFQILLWSWFPSLLSCKSAHVIIYYKETFYFSDRTRHNIISVNSIVTLYRWRTETPLRRLRLILIPHHQSSRSWISSSQQWSSQDRWELLYSFQTFDVCYGFLINYEIHI